MSNPVSSSRTERARTRPWYREPWPWLLAAGPLAVVVASIWSAWIAIESNDGLVAEDYYKRGLLINSKLKDNPANDEAKLGATLNVGENGEVRARVDGAMPTAVAPVTLRLRLAHPADPAQVVVVRLRRDASGDYVGMLPQQSPGRWVVSLESDAWRLPTTTMVGRLTELRLGAAVGQR